MKKSELQEIIRNVLAESLTAQDAASTIHAKITKEILELATKIGSPSKEQLKGYPHPDAVDDIISELCSSLITSSKRYKAFWNSKVGK